MGAELIVLLIVFLSIASNYMVYRILQADPNVVTHTQLSGWIIPEAAEPVALEVLEYHMEIPSAYHL